MGEQQDAAVAFLQGEGVQGTISRFAQDSYGMLGRGLVRVEVPRTPTLPGTTLAMTDMVYQTLETLRVTLADVGEDSRESAEITLRMMETYDPTKQAVVVLSFEGGPMPVSLKMRLAEPFVEG